MEKGGLLASVNTVECVNIKSFENERRMRAEGCESPEEQSN